MKNKCLHCNKVFESKKCHHRKFCSRQCSAAFRKGITYEERICRNCNKKFKIEPSRKQDFCSFQCGVDYNKGIKLEEKECLHCGKLFKIEKWRHQKFCSVICGIDFNRGKPKKTPLSCKGKKRRCRHEIKLKDGRRVFAYRYVVEKKIGRQLSPQEQVHHINMEWRDNDADNLWLYENAREHMKGHRSIDKLIFSLLKDEIIGFENGEYFRVPTSRGKGRQTNSQGVGQKKGGRKGTCE